MDDSTSDDGSNLDKNDNNVNSKRLKIDDSGLLNSIRSEESSGSSSGGNIEQGTASTSTDSGFPRSRNTKNRNYRRSHEEESSSDNESMNVDNNAGNNEDRENDNEEEGEEILYAMSDMVDTGSPPDLIINPNNRIDTSDSEESDSDESDSDNDASTRIDTILTKEKAKHNWFIVPELFNRQLGYSSKLKSSELFANRCYGSLRSVQRLELMSKFEQHKGCVNSLNFHPDGTLLASGSDDLKVAIWDWSINKCLIKYKSKHRSNVFQSRFLHLSGDLHVASCARDGQVRVARVSKEEGVRENRLLGSHRGPCHKLITLKEQPQIILSAGEDGYVLRHDLRENKSSSVVKPTTNRKSMALYSIHGHPLKPHEFLTSGRNEIVRTYDERNADRPLAMYNAFKREPTHNCRQYHVTCAVYNHTGSEILASYSDKDIYLFDINRPNDSPIHQYHGHRNRATIKGVNFFGPKSEFIVSGSDCGYIYIWERNTESIVQWMCGDENGVVNCIEPHPQLPFLCTSGLDWDIKLWVPSCEKSPKMDGLINTIKRNQGKITQWSAYSEDMNNSRMVLMLWRQLRNENNESNTVNEAFSPSSLMFYLNSTSRDSSSDMSDDNEDGDGDSGGGGGGSNRSPCATS